MLDGLRAGEVALDETAIPLDDEAEPARLRRVEVRWGRRLSNGWSLSWSVTRGVQALPGGRLQVRIGVFARGILPPPAPDFGPTEVDGSLSAGEFAFRIMRVQFGIFLAHEPGTRIGEDPEELHDMRVATRRMRAAMKIFEGSLPVRTRSFRDSLKWVAGALGDVRDLDVQLGRLEAWISDAAPEDREPLWRCAPCSRSNARRRARPCSARSTRDATRGS